MLSHLNSIFVYADLLQSDMLAAVIQDEASQVTQQPASVLIKMHLTVGLLLVLRSMHRLKKTG